MKSQQWLQLGVLSNKLSHINSHFFVRLNPSNESAEKTLLPRPLCLTRKRFSSPYHSQYWSDMYFPQYCPSYIFINTGSIYIFPFSASILSTVFCYKNRTKSQKTVYIVKIFKTASMQYPNPYFFSLSIRKLHAKYTFCNKSPVYFFKLPVLYPLNILNMLVIHPK